MVGDKDVQRERRGEVRGWGQARQMAARERRPPVVRRVLNNFDRVSSESSLPGPELI